MDFLVAAIQWYAFFSLSSTSIAWLLFFFLLPHLTPVILFDNMLFYAFIRLATRWLCDTMWWITNRIEIYVLFVMGNEPHFPFATYSTFQWISTERKLTVHLFIFFSFLDEKKNTLGNNLQQNTAFYFIEYLWVFQNGSKTHTIKKCGTKWCSNKSASAAAAAHVYETLSKRNKLNIKIIYHSILIVHGFFSLSSQRYIPFSYFKLRKSSVFVRYSIWKWTHHFYLFCLFQSNHFAYIIHIFLYL